MLNEKPSARELAKTWRRWIIGSGTKNDFWMAVITGFGILTGIAYLAILIYSQNWHK